MPVDRFSRILLGDGLTGTDLGDGIIELEADAASGYDPATATVAWMPLIDADGTAVLDADDDLIPTLIPL